MREKTGYYDRHGKAIRDGDKIKAITDDGQIFTGYVEEIDDSWLVVVRANLIVKPANRLADLNDVEILEDE